MNGQMKKYRKSLERMSEPIMNECPSGAIAQLTFLCQRSDSLVSYDIVFSKKRKFSAVFKIMAWFESHVLRHGV